MNLLVVLLVDWSLTGTHSQGQISVKPAGCNAGVGEDRQGCLPVSFTRFSGPGTPVTVSLYIESAGKKIISIDRDRSKVTSLVDEWGSQEPLAFS